MKTDPNHSRIDRRHFLKMTSLTAAFGCLAVYGSYHGKSQKCVRCDVNLAANSKTTTQSGICRNCGGDAHSGNRLWVAPIGGLTRSPERVFAEISTIPFPHPDIAGVSPKACAKLSGVEFPVSRLRAAKFAS